MLSASQHLNFLEGSIYRRLYGSRLIDGTIWPTQKPIAERTSSELPVASDTSELLPGTIASWFFERWPDSDSNTPFHLKDLELADLVADELFLSERIGIFCYLVIAAAASVAPVRSNPTIDRFGAILGIPPEMRRVIFLATPKMIRAGSPGSDDLNSLTPEVAEKVETMVVEAVRAMSSDKRNLSGLMSSLFQHDEDRSALMHLRDLPMVPGLIKSYVDRQARSEYMLLVGNALLVDRWSFPSLHRCYSQTCQRLSVADPPPLFVAEGPVNALVVGSNQPFLRIASRLVDLLNGQELMFVLGHELGHVLADHVTFHTLALALRGVASGILNTASFGLAGAAINTTLMPALQAWFRRAEFTADRAGLLACQDLEVALHAMIKVSGVPMTCQGEIDPRSLRRQYRRHQDIIDESLADRLSDTMVQWNLGHPFWIQRAAELSAWVSSGGYDLVRDGTPERYGKLVKMIKQDGDGLAFRRATVEALAQYLRTELSLPLWAIRRALWSAVIDGGFTGGTPMDHLLQADVVVRRKSGSVIECEINSMLVKGQNVRQAVIPLRGYTMWEYLPPSIRDALIKADCKEVSFVMYKPGAAGRST